MADRADGKPRKKLKSVARALYGGGANQTIDSGIIGELSIKLMLNKPEETECWPDNWMALQVFSALTTQWNIGMSGPTGLRYESIPLIFEAFSIKKKTRAELIYLLRIMENEALQVFKENG